MLKLCTYLQKFIFSPNYHFHNKTSRNMISAKDAILKVKEYAEQGYTFVVVLDLSKYFDTLNHEILINLLRKNVKDERVVQLIKRYLKSGVMENRVAIDTEEGSPQGGLCRARHKPPYDEIDVMPRYVQYS